MMLGSKGILPPMIPRIAPHFMLPQKHLKFAHFSVKKWLLFGVFAGPKFKNPLASKLASDFLTF